MKSYQSGYKALRRICLDREISIFRLLEEERCVIMMEAAKRGLSEAAFKQMMAVVAMINEGVGGKGAEGSVLERKFRKSVTKSINLVKKRRKKRLPGKMRDVMKLI